ncbi:MAG: PAS domain-containing hybrid sensor histidine kinase/response regulator [Paraglaciecola sp.]|uniref:PAS domain-containing hybrid sensor histidine kinase/response regulator n=2 Tax=Paraglaciecola sp. TaxID=1920173 RepID=UPI00326709BD
MAFGWIILALTYLVGLFFVAKWGEKGSPLATKLTSHPVIYSLALAIYCTAWTFFGAVGEAARNTWQYLPILLGPIIVYLFGYRFIFKLTLVSKKQHITTIADFISSRYGKRQLVALLVTIIALLATIPYVALQLKAIGAAFQIVTKQENSELIVMLATGFIALFSIYFGTQRTDVTEHRHGLILAIALESSLKLAALVGVCFIGYRWSISVDQETFKNTLKNFNDISDFGSFSFIAQTIMAAAAVVCLPRQYHIAVIDNLKLKHLRTARWLFPLYLAITAAVIPIIAASGQTILGHQDPDTYVLSLAMASDTILIQVLVFLGGLSAATAMIIIATLTLSTMITNDVIMPKILSKPHNEDTSTTTSKNYASVILIVRRLVIGCLLLLAYIYQQQMTGSRSLASIGLIAFSLVIQLLPAIVGGLYWKKGHAHGVYAGLSSGLFTWILWIILPLSNELANDTLHSDAISMVALLSLSINTLTYIVFSYFAPDRLIDRLQSQAFVSPREGQVDESKKRQTLATVSDLSTLLSTFLGEPRTQSLLVDFERRSDIQLDWQKPPQPDFLMFCEKALGGVLGSSSAKRLIDSVLIGKKLNFEEVVTFFDDTTQAIQFNASALFTSIENLEQGISVIDKNLNLVAWNKRYLQLFDYPDDLISVGTPIEKMVYFNAVRGECGIGEVDTLVKKRIDHLKAGHPHKFVRQRSDGKMIEMVGNPLPGGGFVTSFADITSHIEIQKALKEANINLERRIERRGQEVQAINAELRLEIDRRAQLEHDLVKAKQAAEEANASKTRFLAFASHDVLQPLNAAKLYLSVLDEADVTNDVREVLNKLNDSVISSETLIATLLDIARLDQNELSINKEPLSLRMLLSPLIDEFSMKAKEQGLDFRTRLTDCWVTSDKTSLYRIVQNLLSNAIKYTNTGKILITARIRTSIDDGQSVLLQVWDTGIGMAKSEQNKVFDDFYRVTEHLVQGVGLGLGVVSRLKEKLDIPMTLRSKLGKGSCFSIILPIATPQPFSPITLPAVKTDLAKLKVLCVDDIAENLDAISTLFEKWNILNSCVQTTYQAITVAAKFEPNALVVDYQLSDPENGLQLITKLREQMGKALPAILVTANREQSLLEQCKQQGVEYLSKPIKPAKLRALLNSFKTKI